MAQATTDGCHGTAAAASGSFGPFISLYTLAFTSTSLLLIERITYGWRLTRSEPRPAVRVTPSSLSVLR
jgi:hypothetical protein